MRATNNNNEHIEMSTIAQEDFYFWKLFIHFHQIKMEKD